MLFNEKEIGKIALLLAISNKEEEEEIFHKINESTNDIRTGVSFVAGASKEVNEKIINNILGCALKENIVSSSCVHGLLHAGVSAFGHFGHDGLLYGHLKIKIAIVANKEWIAVALYGLSSINKLTNHEKSSLSIYHL